MMPKSNTNSIFFQEWDDDLAYLAKLNVLQCKMAHDKCRNTGE